MIYMHTLPVVLLKPVRLLSEQGTKHMNKSWQDLSQRSCFIGRQTLRHSISLWGCGVQTPSLGKGGRDRHEPLHLQRATVREGAPHCKDTEAPW